MLNVFLQFAVETAGEKSGIAVLGINPVSLLLQFVTFIILFFLLKKFAFSSIVEMLEKRRKTIDNGVRLGQKMAAEQEKLEQDVAAALHKARAEADKIIAAGHQEAGQIIKEAETAAAKKVESMLSDAKVHIDDELKRAKAELKRETLTLVAEAAGAVLEEKVDSSKDADLLRRAVEGASR